MTEDMLPRHPPNHHANKSVDRPLKCQPDPSGSSPSPTPSSSSRRSTGRCSPAATSNRIGVSRARAATLMRAFGAEVTGSMSRKRNWYTFLAVGQGLGEGEELSDGVFCAGDAHLDPVAADRNAGGQAGEPAVEGVDGDRDADPGAAGLAKCGQHPVSAGSFVPEGDGLLELPELAEARGAGEGADADPPPDISLICDEEIAEAVKVVLESQFATAKDELVVKVARLLGIGSTRHNVASRLGRVIGDLANEGELVLDAADWSASSRRFRRIDASSADYDRESLATSVAI